MSKHRIDTSMLPHGIRRRMEDRTYLDSFRGRPCEACGTEDGTIVAAHVSVGHEGGQNRKADDNLTVALCSRCHESQGANPGPWWWLQNFMKPMLRRRYQAWLAGRVPRGRDEFPGEARDG